MIQLESEGSHLSLRTWKESPDPERDVKKAYIVKLRRLPNNPPVVLSGDEIGPSQRIPQGGSGWFPKERTGGIPAEYQNGLGTTYYFPMLNDYHQPLSGPVALMKHAARWLEFLTEERAKYPIDQVVYIVQGRLSSHWTHEIRWWARRNHVVLVPSATHWSRTNPVETHARDLEELARPGTHFTTVAKVEEALDPAAAYRTDERIRRGRRFRKTVRKNRRHQARIPVWLRTTTVEVASQPVL